MTFELDRRTRSDIDRRPIAAGRFFSDEFPGLAAAHGRVVAAGIKALNAPDLSVEVDAEAWTIVRDGDDVAWKSGTRDGALVVRLTPDQFSDWAQNQVTFNGLLVARCLEFRNGTLADVSAWDSLWIALLEGWPVVDEGLTFVDRHGAPLNLATTFTVDDDPRDIAHFLREAGFVHLRGWLDPEDLALVSRDMDVAAPTYVEGDGKSWWATLKDGSRRCVRMQEFVEHSPTTAKILSGARWEQLRHTLGGADALARPVVAGRVIEALFKPVGVVSGPSDLSFHRDCHLGRHAYVCSGMTIGIPLTSAGPRNGMLRVVAGSHRVAMPVDVAQTRSYLPVVALPAEVGDLTVHLSCTLHEAQAPVLAERRVMYTGFSLEPRDGAEPDRSSVDQLRERVSDILRDEHAAQAGAAEKSTHGRTGWTAHRGKLAVEILVNFALPFAIYSLGAPRYGSAPALMASSAPPIAWSILSFIRERKIDAISLLVLSGIGLSLLAFAGGGGVKFLQLREQLVTGLVGLVFLGSAAIGRPLILELAKAGARRGSAERAATVENLGRTPAFRRALTGATLIWGAGLLATCAINCALVFVLTIKQFMLVSSPISWAMIGLLTLWTYRSVPRALRRAQARQASDAA